MGLMTTTIIIIIISCKRQKQKQKAKQVGEGSWRKNMGNRNTVQIKSEHSRAGKQTSRGHEYKCQLPLFIFSF
jgi:hypothetical protein